MSPAEISFVHELIGRPYELGAEGPDAYDCYGLARHVQRVVMGHTMPPAERGDIIQQLRETQELRRWRRVPAPQPWDMVLMGNTGDRSHHIGIWIVPGRRGQILHAHENMGVCIHDPAFLQAVGFNYIRFYTRRA